MKKHDSFVVQSKIQQNWQCGVQWTKDSLVVYSDFWMELYSLKILATTAC